MVYFPPEALGLALKPLSFIKDWIANVRNMPLGLEILQDRIDEVRKSVKLRRKELAAGRARAIDPVSWDDNVISSAYKALCRRERLCLKYIRKVEDVLKDIDTWSRKLPGTKSQLWGLWRSKLDQCSSEAQKWSSEAYNCLRSIQINLLGQECSTRLHHARALRDRAEADFQSAVRASTDARTRLIVEDRRDKAINSIKDASFGMADLYGRRFDRDCEGLPEKLQRSFETYAACTNAGLNSSTPEFRDDDDELMYYETDFLRNLVNNEVAFKAEICEAARRLDLNRMFEIAEARARARGFDKDKRNYLLRVLLRDGSSTSFCLSWDKSQAGASPVLEIRSDRGEEPDEFGRVRLRG